MPLSIVGLRMDEGLKKNTDPAMSIRAAITTPIIMGLLELLLLSGRKSVISGDGFCMVRLYFIKIYQVFKKNQII